MVHTNEMLGEIIGKVLLSWVPLHIEISYLDLICHPKESHFHRSGELFLDGVVRYTSGCEVITMDWCWGLPVAHFFEGQS